MFPRPFRSIPTYNRTVPYMPAPFGLFGGLLLICGLIAIGSFFAPGIVEQAIPGWRERVGILVMFGVALGFIRSIWRLFIPILGVAFWIVAVLCLWKPGISGISPHLLTSATPSSQRYEQPHASYDVLPTYKPLPPALPDSAYFVPHSSAGSLDGDVNSFIRRVMHGRL